MIQRIQSLFLLAIVILMVSLMFVKIWEKKSVTTSRTLTLSAVSLQYKEGDAVVDTEPAFYILIFAVIAAGVAAYSLLSYKNRMRQLQLGLTNTLVIGALLGVILYFSLRAQPFITDVEKGNYGLGLIIPSAALMCNMLALRYIRKDEDTVRAADRMR